VPELCVISPLRSSKKYSAVSYYRALILVLSSQRLTANSLRWKNQSPLHSILNQNPKTCLPDYKLCASLMIKKAVGNVLNASWSVRQLSICLNSLSSSTHHCSSQAYPNRKLNPLAFPYQELPECGWKRHILKAKSQKTCWDEENTCMLNSTRKTGTGWEINNTKTDLSLRWPFPGFWPLNSSRYPSTQLHK
jgi:hypothetical protein